jgi:hypothetical protein
MLSPSGVWLRCLAPLVPDTQCVLDSEAHALGVRHQRCQTPEPDTSYRSNQDHSGGLAERAR